MDPDQLQTIPLFAKLSADHLALVAELGHERSFEAKEVIFREGDAGAEFFVVLSGKVRISKAVPGAGEEALAILGPGSHFGEMALMDDTPRSADAIAHLATRLWAIKKQDLDALMRQHQDLAYELLWTFVRTLSARLRETNDKISFFFAISSNS